ncbi:PTS lactose/cellobiose transporter subunit IIA [Melissococcus plutonius]|uniref:PTS system, cellobiose-specific IIA component n=2 Tax=Melissococcus plutonius TaxID=33970 RepID=F3Y9S7_MELPT|nr:PTS lactose/cellobiose transporter subunit IIA [Melissococcus plutonius]BAL62369.1 PTS system cellobiose-specific transporter subunit IIA [Melissococcus plutonius DAT561]AIM24787.1 PTS system cellobiose-specific transporter subunit IIA [Melissococcus plutonius S1]KMT24904.1 PTS system cellobiose-specific transporter subunit IIA [Melissococcus plutonius]KMT26541.1 PTS system cellobiose-specific transporter subunit IIA [Melissococcus plutonius]KMT27791.1 PTS system cellobiose-specific transpo
MEEKTNNLEVAMHLIVYGGNAKSDAMEAITAAKKGDFELADQKIKDAENSLVQAHHSQTAMLTQEAKGESVPISLLTVHSQDHLMTAIAFTDLAKEFIEVYRQLNEVHR